MAQRIKGQEVALVFSSPAGVEEGLVDVQSFEAELDVEILQEKFLGETADRYDDIYNGVSGNAEFQIETVQYFRFTERVQERSQRRTPADAQFQIVAAFAFPNGTRARLIFEDVFWGPLPIRTPSRNEYVTVRVEWKGSNLRRIL